MVKKAPRDPGAPKRNMSAYLLYQNAMREQFKALNPGMTFGQLAKYTSAMYAEMPAQEKEAWVARAEADKQRYLAELEAYVPPPGYDTKGDAIAVHGVETTSSRRTGGSRSKIEKDANAPKRNMSAYLLYQNAMREQFKRENPGMTFGQLAKYTSHMYKNLTPEEKASWDARSSEDKARYDAEIAVYVPPAGYDAKGNMIEDQRPRKRNKKAKKDPAAPKRASGAYVFFTNEMRPVVMKDFPDIKFVDMGRVLGERWRALVPEEKRRFEEMAAQDKVRFQMEQARYKEQHRESEEEEEQAMEHHQAEHHQVEHHHHHHQVPLPQPSSSSHHYYQQDPYAAAQAYVPSYDQNAYQGYHQA